VSCKNSGDSDGGMDGVRGLTKHTHSLLDLAFTNHIPEITVINDEFVPLKSDIAADLKAW